MSGGFRRFWLVALSVLVVSSPALGSPALVSLALAPMDADSQLATVTLSAPAISDATVALALDSPNPTNDADVSFPSSVVVPAGRRFATFLVKLGPSITTCAPVVRGPVRIVATYAGASVFADVVDNPPPIAPPSLTLLPSVTWRGGSSTGTIRVGAPSSVNVTVTLTSSDPNVQVQGTATLLANRPDVSFPIQALTSVTSSTATITASFVLRTTQCLVSRSRRVVLTATLGISPASRGVSRDLWADVILGKPDFGEISLNGTTSRRVFHTGGVLVDRSVRPNRIYVYDGGNSRVLGMSHIGTCTGGARPGLACTSDSDCPGSTCAIQDGIGADLVLGQPSMNRSACNGDGNFQNYPTRAPASAQTLCSMPENQVSISEGGSFANMAVDGAGNLYVPDFYNNRVLRYDSPFATDTVADYVWGQADFAGNGCNRGRDDPGQKLFHPDAQSLCFRHLTFGFTGGVAVDVAGNLWVADSGNDRVLRFPVNRTTGVPAPVADLVLGQPDFTTSFPDGGGGTGIGQMRRPAAVRVDSSGTVYVADSQDAQDPATGTTGRVLVFAPPFTNGMDATRTLGSGLRRPTGLEFDPDQGLWVSDTGNDQLLLFVGDTIEKVLFKDVPDFTGQCGGAYTGDGPRLQCPGDDFSFDSSNVCDAFGGVGVDADGNVLIAAAAFVQDLWRFPAPIPLLAGVMPGTAHSADRRIFAAYQFARPNEVGPATLESARGVAVSDNQLIVADTGRLLFWNNPLSVTTGRAADGFLGADGGARSFLVEDQVHYGRIAADGLHHLWVIRNDRIQVFTLPLTTGALPFKEFPGSTGFAVVNDPNPIIWDFQLAIGGISVTADATRLWIADPRRHRVFRVRDPLGASPVVDVVLGQADAVSTACNRGNGGTDKTQLQPSRDSLCFPGGVALDPQGNVWVADASLEQDGNDRLLEYDAALFPPSPASPVFGPLASRVFGTAGSFTSPGTSCPERPLCSPLQPAFSATGDMVLGMNGMYFSFFPLIFRNPITNPAPVAALKDFFSMPYAATFDSSNNLYVTDNNRGRVLVYKSPLN